MCLTSEGVLSMEMNRQHGGSYLEQFDCNWDPPVVGALVMIAPGATFDPCSNWKPGHSML